MNSEPLVSVVTPFYNTQEFLAECIESVLAQTYTNWEYILVDNQSNDGSSEIAREYANRFPEKIRLIRTEQFLSQVQNYNFALSQIVSESKYCKMVQADDWIYPECLARMVAAAETDDSIGIVSSYRLKGRRVMGEGLAPNVTKISGSAFCRQQLTTGLFAFGTPTTVLYRSDIIRQTSPFFDESALHEDTDACYRTLRTWNLGFVHQVLSFSRVDNDSIMTRLKNFGPEKLDKLLQLHKFGSTYLDSRELAIEFKDWNRQYYGFLAHRLLMGSSSAFWQYHVSGLKTIGRKLDKGMLLKHIILEFAWFLFNPAMTFSRLFDRLHRAEEKSSTDPNTEVSPAPVSQSSSTLQQR